MRGRSTVKLKIAWAEKVPHVKNIFVGNKVVDYLQLLQRTFSKVFKQMTFSSLTLFAGLLCFSVPVLIQNIKVKQNRYHLISSSSSPL